MDWILSNNTTRVATMVRVVPGYDVIEFHMTAFTSQVISRLFTLEDFAIKFFEADDQRLEIYVRSSAELQANLQRNGRIKANPWIDVVNTSGEFSQCNGSIQSTCHELKALILASAMKSGHEFEAYAQTSL